MPGFWSGFSQGVNERLQTAQGADKEKALLLLKGIIEGNVTQKTPEELQTAGIRPPNIGQRIMSGLGLSPSPEVDISRYNVMPMKEWQPKTREEALSFEREKYGIKAESPQEKTRQARANLIDSTKIREEFLNRPEVKEYTLINTQVSSMDALLKEAKVGNIQNKVALDQALITMFNKLTDPNSVVRESEYARTPKNLPLANRFSGALQKLEAGGAGLTNSDREALVWGAKVIADERGKTYNQTLQEYVDLSKQYGIEENLITRGKIPHKEYGLGSQNKYIKRGIDQETGKRVGMLPDGTIEEITQ